jgi:PAS domain S-box-containing protein
MARKPRRITVPEVVSRLRTHDGLFMTDDDQVVVYWSAGAEQLLGHAAEDVIGKTCFEVMAGADFAGHPFCRDRCPVALNANKGRAVRDYDVAVHTREGDPLLVNNSVILWPLEGGGFAPVHVFRPVKRGRSGGQSRRRSVKAADDEADSTSVTPLSRREWEVIRLAAMGLSTAEIAEAGGVSFFTARNQLSSLMRKLNARNRAEAIARATEHGLL